MLSRGNISASHTSATPRAGGKPVGPIVRGTSILSWIPAPAFASKRMAGMSFVLLSGCMEVGAPMVLSIKTPGDVITEIKDSLAGVEVGQTEIELATAFAKFGYSDEPTLTRITSPDIEDSDCGEGAPALMKSFVREGIYEGQNVEFQANVYFADEIKGDGICSYVVKFISPVKVREPSYMKEL